MDDTIITTYYLCDEFLKAIGHHDDPQVRLSTAEVMSVALESLLLSSVATSRPAARSWTSMDTYKRQSPKAVSIVGYTP